MKKMLILMAVPVLLLACQPKTHTGDTKTTNNETAVSFIKSTTVEKITKELINKHGEAAKERITRGVKQSAALWREKDGKEAEFEKFCIDNFIASESKLDSVFQRLSTHFETIYGLFNKMSINLKEPVQLEIGDMLPIDEVFGAYEPSAHVINDFYENKIAFHVSLNFPFYSLKEKTELGAKWSRKEWAYARMGDIFTTRIPSELIQKYAEVTSAADNYISNYYIFMGNLVNEKGENLFAKDLRLITHWGLRDEIKANYSDKEKGFAKQKMVYEVMKKIISQEIPQMVINNKEYQWNPVTNKVSKDGKDVQTTPEPNTRYQTLLNNFLAAKSIDAYSPNYPSYIQRKFDLEMEIPVEDVEKLFIELVSSPQVKKVAALISQRLGRKIEPFDIWYDGFKSRSNISQTELDQKSIAKYPNVPALQKDLVEILKKFGFKPEKAEYICSKIQVDPARGAGHASGAVMKGDKARLRTHFGKNGMDYKGYNIAVHEFGHNVEQTLTLYDIDYYMLNGVPNTSFTEALAFIFQKRDLDLLGIKDNNPNKFHLMALDNFWASYEIMGVSLVDINVWKWLYAHPNATAAELKEAVITIAKDIWNKYYADVFGTKDELILGIYSHMIDYPLYLSAYPIGHLIDFQIDKFIEGKNFSEEVMRVFKAGRIVPQLWMKNAVGKEISNEPLLNSVEEALKVIK